MAVSSSRTDVSSTGATGLEEHDGKEETTVIEWVGEAKHIKSKRVRLTKIVHGDIGNFTFHIVPLVRGGGRGRTRSGHVVDKDASKSSAIPTTRCVLPRCNA